MRVAHRFASLIAVLAAVLLQVSGVAALDNSSYSVGRFVRKLPPFPNHWASSDRDSGSGEGRQKRSWLTAREMQAVVRREGGELGGPVDCCPSVVEMVEPTGGKNLQGMYVDLYMDGDIRQRFYELSCRADVENKPCRFVDRKLYNQSRCVQKYSYTYALARDASGDHPQRHQQRRQRQISSLPDGGWMLDYIRVRSGCACELRPKRKHKPHERKKHEVEAFESPPDI